jgi:hypothetical protein
VIVRSLAGIFTGITRAGQTLTRRMLPGEGTLPSSVMAFFAVAVPLVIVTIATVVYLQRGRTSQYQAYFIQAAQAAEQAQAETDPQARRATWEEVIAYLDRAEAYQTTPASKALRTQAQSFFDQRKVRRPISPAISGSVPTYQIGRMVTTENDLPLDRRGVLFPGRSGLDLSSSAVRATLQGKPAPSSISLPCRRGTS